MSFVSPVTRMDVGRSGASDLGLRSDFRGQSGGCTTISGRFFTLFGISTIVTLPDSTNVGGRSSSTLVMISNAVPSAMTMRLGGLQRRGSGSPAFSRQDMPQRHAIVQTEEDERKSSKLGESMQVVPSLVSDCHRADKGFGHNQCNERAKQCTMALFRFDDNSGFYGGAYSERHNCFVWVALLGLKASSFHYLPTIFSHPFLAIKHFSSTRYPRSSPHIL